MKSLKHFRVSWLATPTQAIAIGVNEIRDRGNILNVPSVSIVTRFCDLSCWSCLVIIIILHINYPLDFKQNLSWFNNLIHARS